MKNMTKLTLTAIALSVAAGASAAPNGLMLCQTTAQEITVTCNGAPATPISANGCLTIAGQTVIPWIALTAKYGNPADCKFSIAGSQVGEATMTMEKDFVEGELNAPTVAAGYSVVYTTQDGSQPIAPGTAESIIKVTINKTS